MKRILYIGGFELPDKNAAAHRVLANAKIFKKIGYEVEFLGVNKTNYTHIEHADFIVHRGFDISNNKVEYYLSAKRIINQLNKKKYDFVIAYNYPSLPLLLIRKVCKKRRINLILDLTEWYSVKGISFFGKIFKSIDVFLRMRIIAKKSDGLILISDYLNEYYRKIDNKVVIPPLVDKYDVKWLSGYENTNKTKVVFSYSGNPGKDKDNLSKIIDIFSKNEVANVSLNVIGVSIDQINLKKSLIDQDKVVFFGQVDHKECINLVKESDFAILFRYNNRVSKAGFPTKFVESTSLGIPMIINKYTNLEKKYIHSGVIVVENSNIFVDKLEEIISNRSKFKQEAIKNSDIFDFRNFIEAVDIFVKKIEDRNKSSN